MLIEFAISPSFKVLIIGIPPHTAASYSKFTLFFSASWANWFPYLAIKALLAVITCFLFFKALKTNFLAGPSAPPINSTIISISFFLVASI